MIKQRQKIQGQQKRMKGIKREEIQEKRKAKIIMVKGEKVVLNEKVTGNAHLLSWVDPVTKRPIATSVCTIEGEKAEMVDLTVNPNFQNAKLATVMLEQIKQRLKDEGVDTLELWISSDTQHRPWSSQAYINAGFRHDLNNPDRMVLTKLHKVRSPSKWNLFRKIKK
ncbi:MAG: GNAT family N-acetyltransferase [Candidatus Micrarchaeota archaeon]